MSRNPIRGRNRDTAGLNTDDSGAAGEDPQGERSEAEDRKPPAAPPSSDGRRARASPQPSACCATCTSAEAAEVG